MGTAASTTIDTDAKRIMVVISSPLGEHSCSNAIVKAFVDAYVVAHPGVAVSSPEVKKSKLKLEKQTG